MRAKGTGAGGAQQYNQYDNEPHAERAGSSAPRDDVPLIPRRYRQTYALTTGAPTPPRGRAPAGDRAPVRKAPGARASSSQPDTQPAASPVATEVRPVEARDVPLIPRRYRSVYNTDEDVVPAVRPPTSVNFAVAAAVSTMRQRTVPKTPPAPALPRTQATGREVEAQSSASGTRSAPRARVTRRHAPPKAPLSAKDSWYDSDESEPSFGSVKPAHKPNQAAGKRKGGDATHSAWDPWIAPDAETERQINETFARMQPIPPRFDDVSDAAAHSDTDTDTDTDGAIECIRRATAVGDYATVLRLTQRHESLLDFARDTYARLVGEARGERERLSGAAMRPWLALGLLDEDTYLRCVAPLAVSAGDLRLLLVDVATGDVSAQGFFRHVAPSPSDAVQWVVDGLLRGDTLLQQCEAITHEHAAFLYEQQLISREAYIGCGKAPHADSVQWALDGLAQAKDVLERYEVSDEILFTLLRRKRPDDSTFAAHFRRGLWAPRSLVPGDATAATLNDAVRALAAPRDAAARRSLRLQVMAAGVEALQNDAEVHVRGRPAQQPAAPEPATRPQPKTTLRSLTSGVGAAMAQLRRRTSRAQAPLPAPTSVEAAAVAPSVSAAARMQVVHACLACLEPFTDEDIAFVSDHCDHPGQFHEKCVGASVAAQLGTGLRPSCPSVGCSQPLRLENGRDLGLDADTVDAWSTAIIRSHRPLFWQGCTTQGCVGGMAVEPGQLKTLDCALCEMPTQVDTRIPIDKRVSDVLLLEMLDGMGPYKADAVRSCYHCGMATARRDGCATMVCGSDTHGEDGAANAGCGQSWHFIHGVESEWRSTWQGTRQKYVPLAGDMVEAGLYEPLVPGQLLHNAYQLPEGVSSVQELVARNAIARGWLARRKGRYVLTAAQPRRRGES